MLEFEIYDLLKSYNLSTPKYASFGLDSVPSIDFYPVALKLSSSKVVHKSEYGAVQTDIKNKDDLINNVELIKSNVASKGVKLDASDKFLATEMVKGVELFAGIIDDEIFGKVILFGRGGVMLELDRDVCYIRLEADEQEIINSINSTKISKIFRGFRGKKYDINLIIDFIKNIQNFIQQNEAIKECDFNPVILNDNGLFIVDARIKKDDTQKPIIENQNRHSFFTNSNVAIIGASTNPSKVGFALAKNMSGFSGNVFLVNSSGGKFEGQILYKDIDEISDDIDTAFITIPQKYVLESIEKLISKNIKNIVIISAGFKEVGDVESEEKILNLAKKHNINIIGPNCLGYYEGSKNLNGTFATKDVKNGGLALLAGSGAVLSSLMDKASLCDMGFSHIVSLGNMIDLSYGELIQMLENEHECKAISLYIEGIKNPTLFIEAIKKSSKPIYLYKTGQSEAGKKAAFSHTGNLAGNYELFCGIMKSLGVNMVDNIEALIYKPLRKADNIAILTNAGGPATVLADLIVKKGKTLYELSNDDIKALDEVLPFNWSKNNPVDIIGDATSARYESALNVMMRNDKIDLIYVILTPQYMTDIKEIAILISQFKSSKIVPIFLGGGLIQDALKVFRVNKTLYFTSLDESVCFL
jgi:acyl-CoA synthetase (NDP forming)